MCRMSSENSVPLNLKRSDKLPRAFGLVIPSTSRSESITEHQKPKRAFGTVLHQNADVVKPRPVNVAKVTSSKITGGYWDASPVKRARAQQARPQENAPQSSFTHINPNWEASPSPIKSTSVLVNEDACNAWRYGKPQKQESHVQPTLPVHSDLNNSFTEKISNLNLDIANTSQQIVQKVSKPERRFLAPSTPNPFLHEEEYIETILARWYELEQSHKITPSYMTRQKEISFKMRTILIEWLVEVAGEYAIHNATLHRGVQFVDRFLSRMQVSRNNLQLVGTTCLFLASKIEEIHPPDTQDLVYITDNTYDKRQVLKMECLVLSILDFDLLTPTAHEFTDYYTTKLKLSSTTKSCCFYLIELTLLHGENFLKFIGSVISLSACYVAIRICGDQREEFKNNRTKEVCVENVIGQVKSLNPDLIDNVNLCVSRILLMIISNNDNAICTKYRKFQEQTFVLAATSIAACLPFPLYHSQ